MIIRSSVRPSSSAYKTGWGIGKTLNTNLKQSILSRNFAHERWFHVKIRYLLWTVDVQLQREFVIMHQRRDFCFSLLKNTSYQKLEKILSVIKPKAQRTLFI